MMICLLGKELADWAMTPFVKSCLNCKHKLSPDKAFCQQPRKQESIMRGLLGMYNEEFLYFIIFKIGIIQFFISDACEKLLYIVLEFS